MKGVEKCEVEIRVMEYMGWKEKESVVMGVKEKERKCQREQKKKGMGSKVVHRQNPNTKSFRKTFLPANSFSLSDVMSVKSGTEKQSF